MKTSGPRSLRGAERRPATTRRAVTPPGNATAAAWATPSTAPAKISLAAEYRLMLEQERQAYAGSHQDPDAASAK
ncbi:hypothetical protein [Leucobacter chromiireducens]|uniref:hypothetical protein n=1 Tax=Leucobacter chromiireducens TaxID=283877 RepID=UPI003F7EE29C